MYVEYSSVLRRRVMALYATGMSTYEIRRAMKRAGAESVPASSTISRWARSAGKSRSLAEVNRRRSHYAHLERAALAMVSRGVDLKTVARELGVGYATVRRWRRKRWGLPDGRRAFARRKEQA